MIMTEEEKLRIYQTAIFSAAIHKPLGAVNTSLPSSDFIYWMPDNEDQFWLVGGHDVKRAAKMGNKTAERALAKNKAFWEKHDLRIEYV